MIYAILFLALLIGQFLLPLKTGKKVYAFRYILGMTIICISFGHTIILVLNEEKDVPEKQIISVSEQINFEDSVKQYIESLNIAHPEIVFKQARIESGNFTSRIFKENKNLFGMRVPYQRPNLAIGENRGYAVYENWKHSVIDYALLQAWSYKKLNRDEYLKQLSISYAEDTLYIQKVK